MIEPTPAAKWWFSVVKSYTYPQYPDNVSISRTVSELSNGLLL